MQTIVQYLDELRTVEKALAYRRRNRAQILTVNDDGGEAGEPKAEAEI